MLESAGVTQQDEGNRSGRVLGRPQDAGNLIEDEVAFNDAVVEMLFGSEAQGQAFRDCRRTALPDDLSSDRNSAEERPGRRVHGHHLLDSRAAKPR